MDIPSQLPGGLPGFTGPASLGKGITTAPASPRLDVDLIKQLGLSSGARLQTVVKALQLDSKQWNALLEITAITTQSSMRQNQTTQSLTMPTPATSNILPATPEPLLLQVVSTRPLQTGQLLELLLDNDNRLQVVEPQKKATAFTNKAQTLNQDLSKPVLEKILASLLPKANRQTSNVTTPTRTSDIETSATLWEKILQPKASRNPETTLPLLQQLPRSDRITQQVPLLKKWIAETSSIYKKYSHTNETAHASLKNVSEKNELTSTESEEPLEHFLRAILSSALFENITALNPRGTANSPAEILLVLKKILEVNNHTSTDNLSTKSNPGNTSPKEDNNELASVLKSLIDRLEQFQNNHQVNKSTLPDTSQSFKCDIPIWHKQDGQAKELHNVQLTIEREKQSASEKSKDKMAIRWRVVLDFDLKYFGALQAEALIRESQVNIALWAEKKESRQQIESKLENFRQQLLDKGIPLEGIHCRQQKPTQRHASQIYTLLDMRG